MLVKYDFGTGARCCVNGTIISVGFASFAAGTGIAGTCLATLGGELAALP